MGQEREAARSALQQEVRRFAPQPMAADVTRVATAPAAEDPIARFLMGLVAGQPQEAPTGPSIGPARGIIPLDILHEMDQGPLGAVTKLLTGLTPADFSPAGPAAAGLGAFFKGGADDISRLLGRHGASEIPLRRRIAEAIDPSTRGALQEAFTDPMTGLSNTTAFGRAVPRINADPNKHFVVFDLTNFKAINDQISFSAGNERLTQVGRVIAETARKHGLNARDLFRAGGDEFAVAGTDPKKLEAFAQEVTRLLPDIKAGDFTSSIRFGVGSNFDEAMNAATAKKPTETGRRFRP